MYKITQKEKELIHKALITASDNGTFDEFTKDELDLINEAESIVNKLTIPVVVQAKPEKVCKGSMRLGTGCGKCKRCKRELEHM